MFNLDRAKLATILTLCFNPVQETTGTYHTDMSDQHSRPAKEEE